MFSDTYGRHFLVQYGHCVSQSFVYCWDFYENRVYLCLACHCASYDLFALLVIGGHFADGPAFVAARESSE